MPFCGNAEVVESKHYRHPDSGRTFSVFSSYVEPGSELIVRGFDIHWTGDGTVGRCRAPFETRAEADAYAAKWNAERAARGAA